MRRGFLRFLCKSAMNGKIHDVVAVMTGLPYGATSGWSQ
jgi:hypothetical protein